MKVVNIDYNIKGSFILEVPEESFIEESSSSKNLNVCKKELKDNFIYDLNDVLVRKPETYGFKADFKVTKVSIKIEDIKEGEKDNEE